MKKIIRVLLIVFAISFMFPAQTFAASHKGYKVVKLTKKNASKYFGFKKVKSKDEFGDYDGYSYRMYNKLNKKKYYIYETKKFALKVHYKERYKRRSDGQAYTEQYTTTISGLGNCLTSSGAIWDYKYAKLLNTKIKKAKGTVIFIKPSNIIGVKKMKSGDSTYYRIKLKYPYDKNTLYEEHYDAAKGKWVVDYYYKDVWGKLTSIYI